MGSLKHVGGLATKHATNYFTGLDGSTKAVNTAKELLSNARKAIGVPIADKLR